MNYNDLLTNIFQLPKTTLVKILDIIKEIIKFEIENSLNHNCCPKCNSSNFTKNGKTKKKKQRYICNNCNKSFSINTNTVFWYSKVNVETWERFITLMFDDANYSLDKKAKTLGLAKTTVFFMRHKICDLLGEFSVDNNFNGTVECDEFYETLSFKGQSNPNRKARKRGVRKLIGKPKNENEEEQRGLGDNQVCILTLTDSSNRMFFKKVKQGKINSQTVKDNLTGVIDEGSIFCTDGDKSYIKFAAENKLEHKRITPIKYIGKMEHHINNINYLHGRYRDWIKRFKGVSTKYLQSYLNWFIFLIKIIDNEYILEKIKTIINEAPKLRGIRQIYNQPLFV